MEKIKIIHHPLKVKKKSTHITIIKVNLKIRIVTDHLLKAVKVMNAAAKEENPLQVDVLVLVLVLIPDLQGDKPLLIKCKYIMQKVF